MHGVFLSLKEVGWGPPERKMAYRVKLARKSNLSCKKIGLLYFILVYFLSKVVCVREGFRLGSSCYLKQGCVDVIVRLYFDNKHNVFLG